MKENTRTENPTADRTSCKTMVWGLLVSHTRVARRHYSFLDETHMWG
ncbi:gp53 [Bacillus phage TP21-L]|uniref:Gp53 n=1 Tax=Bacillus phage TP21-L TaxID=565140 RepID=B8R862_9CAUD|nr:gp53 [Bacillus phage TP21-L]ACJ70579.1 gp53 [Bacillus phage TP21-L]